MIKGAIFDLDGTLLDSQGMWNNLGADYLKSLGIVPQDDIGDVLRPMNMQEAACYMISEYGLNKTPEDIIVSVNKMVSDFYSSRVRLKPFAYEFLKKMHDCNIAMVIATATEIELVRQALDFLGISGFFTGIVTCDMVGSWKDSPAVYRKALELLDVEKDHSVIFEDLTEAVYTAKTDGFRTVGVEDSNNNNINELKAVSDFYLADYRCFELFIKWAEK